MWFGLYSRGDGEKDSSGFEHVFSGGVRPSRMGRAARLPGVLDGGFGLGWGQRHRAELGFGGVRPQLSACRV